jgi:hypothetical protein
VEQQGKTNGKKKKYTKPDIAIVLLEPKDTLVDPCKCRAHTTLVGAVTWYGIGEDCFNSYYGTPCNRYSQS